MVSPSSRQALTSKKSTSSFLERTRFTASPNEQTAIPLLVILSSGSLVRLPARTTRLKLTISLLSLCSLRELPLQKCSRFSSTKTLAGADQKQGAAERTLP